MIQSASFNAIYSGRVFNSEGVFKITKRDLPLALRVSTEGGGVLCVLFLSMSLLGSSSSVSLAAVERQFTFESPSKF